MLSIAILPWSLFKIVSTGLLLLITADNFDDCCRNRGRTLFKRVCFTSGYHKETEKYVIFDLTPEYVILCPGNHDVDLELNKFKVSIQSQEDSEEHLSVDAIKHRVESFKNFVKFPKDLGIPPLQNSVDDDNTIHYLYGCHQHWATRILALQQPDQFHLG